jgi:hypothetical protein
MTLRGKLCSLVGGLLVVAMLVTGGLFFTQAARAQAPQSVPAVRFYGSVRDPAGQPFKGVTVVALVGGIQCGYGSSDNGGNYFVDVQSAAGCTTPGATVKFSFQGLIASQTGTIPSVEGSAQHLDLTFATAPTATPTPPPPPTVVATTPPPPPPTVAPATVRPTTPPAPPTVRPTTPPAPPTERPTVRPTTAPVVQQGAKSAQGPAKGPVKGPVSVQQAPAKAVSQQAPYKPVTTTQAPAYVAPARVAVGAGGAQAAAPATTPRLPSTGTGGLLDQQSNSALSSWAVLLIVLAALGISATGMFAYKRSR